ncbi:MAG: Hsp20/alpha crystallin family protein [Patescibacteria group bacterium]|nr:Hsp20/alpha crystallin family protein [Patescibacteria group bacterium]
MLKSEIEKFFSDEDDFLGGNNTELVASDDNDLMSDELEGQLSIDMYQTDDDLIIKAPVAGVDPNDLEVSVTEDSFVIRGKRHDEHKQEKGNYFVHECYWGSFSRSESLPVPVVAEKAEASINKKGVLTIRVPKSSKGKSKTLKIKTE